MSTPLIRRAALAFLFAATLLNFAAAEELIPAPIDVGNDVAAYVIVPDVSKLLESMDAIAKKAGPPEANAPGVVKLALGKMLEDPALANLGGKPAMFILFKVPPGYNLIDGPPNMAVYIPANAAEPYKKVFEKDGAVSFEDGVLIAAPTPEALKAGQTGKAVYAKLSGAKINSDARLYLNVQSLMESFGPKVEKELKAFTQEIADTIQMFAPNTGLKTAQFGMYAKLMSKGLCGFLNQSEAIQLDLKLTPDSIGIEQTYFARPGTPLATLLAGGSANPWDKNLEALVGKGPMMASTTNFDPASLLAGWNKIVAEINADPEFAELAKGELLQSITDGFAASTGMQAAAVTAEGMSIQSCSAGLCKDEKKLLDLMESQIKFYDKQSMIAKFYAGLGMKMDASFERAARQYKGTAINRMTMTMEMPNMTDAQKDQFKNRMRPSEIAIVKGYSLISQSPEALNKMIDMAAAGDFAPSGFAPKSKAVFGDGRQAYMDMDFLGLLKTTAGGDPGNPVAPLFAALADGASFLMAITIEKGRLSYQLQIPIDPIQKLAKMALEFGQRIEGGPPKPKPTEDGKF